MKKIFIVEDDKSICMELVEILENEGYAASYLTDFEHSKEEILAAGADLILMDIQMPNMNGYEATRRIREFENVKKASIPILAMTANAFEEDKKMTMEAGMNGHISKPIDVNVLEKQIINIFKKVS